MTTKAKGWRKRQIADKQEAEQDPYWPFPTAPVKPYKEPKDFIPYPSDAEEAPI